MEYSDDFDTAWDFLTSDEGQVPFVMVPWRQGQRADLFTGVTRSFATTLQGTLIRMYESSRDDDKTFETFHRWAKTHHDVNARVVKNYGSSQGDEAIVILWPDKKWLNTVGLDEYTPSEDDVNALSGFLWGSLYTFTVERHDTDYDVWYEIGSHGLLLSPDDDVEEQAREALEQVVVH